jgi:hypothetical protein
MFKEAFSFNHGHLLQRYTYIWQNILGEPAPTLVPAQDEGPEDFRVDEDI